MRRASGVPIRVASKSLRCRFLIERALARPGYQGVMCYSLAEALWLHGIGLTRRDLGRGLDADFLVAYPTVDRAALRSLAASESARAAHHGDHRLWTEQLDFIDATLGDGHPAIRVCLDLDMAWRPLPRARGLRWCRSGILAVAVAR